MCVDVTGGRLRGVVKPVALFCKLRASWSGQACGLVLQAPCTASSLPSAEEIDNMKRMHALIIAIRAEKQQRCEREERREWIFCNCQI